MTISINEILNITRSGMLTRLQDLDLISNNLANINTNGFKSSRSNFQEMLINLQYGGTQLRATQRFMDQGSLQMTGNPLDLAISGQGFFAVQLPDGRTAYTRDGQFTLDANNRIVNMSGLPLVWNGQVPPDASGITVNQDGTVMAMQGGTWTQIGIIPLYSVANPNGLINYGGNLLLETEASGATQSGTAGEQGLGKIKNGALEQSNVNMADEMTQLISIQRSFEMSLRTFQQTDQMLALAIRMRK